MVIRQRFRVVIRKTQTGVIRLGYGVVIYQRFRVVMRKTDVIRLRFRVVVRKSVCANVVSSDSHSELLSERLISSDRDSEWL